MDTISITFYGFKKIILINYLYKNKVIFRAGINNYLFFLLFDR